MNYGCGTKPTVPNNSQKADSNAGNASGTPKPSSSPKPNAIVEDGQTDTESGIRATIKLGGGLPEISSKVVPVSIEHSSNALKMMLDENLTFSGKSWQKAEKNVSFTFSSEGQKTLYVKFMNDKNQESLPFTAKILIRIFPTANSVVVTPGSKTRTISGTVTLPKNAVQMMLSADSNFSGGTWITAADSFSYVFPKTRTNTLYLKFKDLDGIESPVYTSNAVEIELFGPNDGSISINNNAPSTSNRLVNLTIMKPKNGIFMKISESQAGLENASWGSAATTTTFLFTSDGIKTIYVKFKDNAGFESPVWSSKIAVLGLGDVYSTNVGMMKKIPLGDFALSNNVSNTTFVGEIRMSVHTITRDQFESVTGLPDPSLATVSSGKSDPVQRVSWYTALVFCNKLSKKEGLSPVYSMLSLEQSMTTDDPDLWGPVPTTNNDRWNSVVIHADKTGYRLPTWAESMWAAMGGPDPTLFPQVLDKNFTGYLKQFPGDTGSNLLTEYTWFDGNSAGKSHPVGTKLPNELGLYDMAGNVFQWVQDLEPGGGGARRFFGSSWQQPPLDARLLSNTRSGQAYPPQIQTVFTIGFRVVRRSVP